MVGVFSVQVLRLFTPDDDTTSQNRAPPGWAITEDIFSRYYFSGGNREHLWILSRGYLYSGEW